MAKPKDLTPKLRSKLKTAEEEFSVEYQHGSLPFGESVGGLQAYSQTFKRGYGDAIFGSNDLGIWLGAADFEDAPFRVDMEGRIYLTTSDGSMVIDTTNKRIIINDGTDDRILIGYQDGGF